MTLTERKFVFLTNPISGTHKKDRLLNYIKNKSINLALNCSFFDTNKEGDYYWLVEKIFTEKITDIIIIGGDGTINSVLRFLKNIDISVGIIPSGSGNGLALTAGIPKNYKKAFDIILTGKTLLTDAFSINQQFACMLSGVGFDAQVAYDFANQKKRGLITYTKQSILNYFKAQPYPFEITIDDFSFFVNAYFISIANSNQFGNQFKIAPHASLQDGLLDIVIVQKMSKLKLPFAIVKQIRGKNKLQSLVDDLLKKNIINLQTSNITIKNSKLAPLHIDGEVAETKELMKFQIQKDYFKMIIP